MLLWNSLSHNVSLYMCVHMLLNAGMHLWKLGFLCMIFLVSMHPFCCFDSHCSFVCVCRILDVQPNRLSVGGVRSIEPVLHRRGQIATHDFVGCIMEFAVNGRPLEPSQALASRGILDRSAAHEPHLSLCCLLVCLSSLTLLTLAVGSLLKL